MTNSMNSADVTQPAVFQALVAQGQALTEAWRNIPVPDRPLSEDALDALYQLGVGALQTGQFAQSEVAFALLLQHLPAHPDYLSGMGHALRGDGNPAAAALMHALALQSAAEEEKTDHAMDLAQVFIDARQPHAAEAVLTALPTQESAQPAIAQLLARARATRALIDRAEH